MLQLFIMALSSLLKKPASVTWWWYSRNVENKTKTILVHCPSEQPRLIDNYGRSFLRMKEMFDGCDEINTTKGAEFAFIMASGFCDLSQLQFKK